jgi:prepilin-type N-terminal cleavage/methylation domain-containing protein
MERRTKFTSQSGTTLVELIVVLVIISVLVSFAVAQFGSSKKNLERQNIVRELKVSLERARFDSVKRRAVNVNEKAKITIHNATSFSFSTDLNQNESSNIAKRGESSLRTAALVLSGQI